jgi:hypothetical protein
MVAIVTIKVGDKIFKGVLSEQKTQSKKHLKNTSIQTSIAMSRRSKIKKDSNFKS